MARVTYRPKKICKGYIMTPEVTLIPGLGCATWREYTQRRIAHVNGPVHNGVIMLDGRKPYDVYIGRHVDRNKQYFEASIWGKHKRLPLHSSWR